MEPAWMVLVLLPAESLLSQMEFDSWWTSSVALCTTWEPFASQSKAIRNSMRSEPCPSLEQRGLEGSSQAQFC